MTFNKRIGALSLGGLVLATSLGSMVPANATNGHEGAYQSVVTPGDAVWGQAANHTLGSYQIPFKGSLQKGFFLDANSNAPRTHFNTVVQYTSVQDLAKDILTPDGKAIPEKGVNQIALAMIMGNSIDSTGAVSPDIKKVLSDYGYKGDYGKEWIETVNKSIPNSPEGEKPIAATEADYVMSALSAAVYNGGSESDFALPVDAATIVGSFDGYGLEGISEDFNSLVSAVKEASANLTEKGSGSKIAVLSYEGNDGAMYKRGLSFVESELPAVKESVKAKKVETPKPTPNPDPTNPSPGPTDPGTDKPSDPPKTGDPEDDKNKDKDKTDKANQPAIPQPSADSNSDGKTDVKDLPETTSTEKNAKGETVSKATGEVLATKDGKLTKAGEKLVKDNNSSFGDTKSKAVNSSSDPKDEKNESSSPSSAVASNGSDGSDGSDTGQPMEEIGYSDSGDPATGSDSASSEPVSYVEGQDANTGSSASSKEEHSVNYGLIAGIAGMVLLGAAMFLKKSKA